jgi:putative acetyltransferase
MTIRQDDLTSAEVQALLQEHLRDVARHSPPESIHALGIEALRRPEITFWTVWDGATLLGCGALKELNEQHAELKSMRTAAHHLRKGVARFLLQHILVEAKQRGYRRISLETGSGPAFVPAHRLYETLGFSFCGPFASYKEDPHSLFLTREV